MTHEPGPTVIFDLGPPRLAELGTLSSSFPGGLIMDAVGDGTRLVVQDRESSAVIDAATGELIELRQAGEANPDFLPFMHPVSSANGLYTAGLDASGESRLWSNLDGREVFAAPDEWQIRGVSEDGSKVVLFGPSARVVSVDGTMIAELELDGRDALGGGIAGGVWRAVFSPDNRYVVTVKGEAIQIWEASTGTQVGMIDDFDLGGVSALWTTDGSLLVVGGFDGTINIFDVARLLGGASDREALVRRIAAHDTFMLLVDIKDGSRILSIAREEPARAWDLESGQMVGEFGTSIEGEFVAASFHPTEPRLYAEVGADQIGIFTLDADELLEIARSRLSRGLTEEECQLYLRRSCAADA